MPTRLWSPSRLPATAFVLLAPALLMGCGPTIVGPPQALLLPCGAHAERGDDGLSCLCRAGYRDTGGTGDAQCAACTSDETCGLDEPAAATVEPEVSCPAHAQPAGDECLCEAGYYLDDAGTPASCLECPEGADCRSPGTTRENLRNLAGYYRASADSTTYYRCAQPALCPADAAPTSTPTPTPAPPPACPDHAVRLDPSAACVCDVDYYAVATASSLVCTPCPSGADCHQPGTLEAQLTAVSGWQRWPEDEADAPPADEVPGPCGAHALEAADGTCSCAPGYFDDLGEGLVCMPCPEGAACTPQTGSVLPTTQAGYFQPPG